MRVLITGAAGMLGSSLMKRFSSLDSFEVLGLSRQDLDLRDHDQLEFQIKSFKPEVIIHAAAKVGGIQANISNPLDFLATNLQMDTNVILTSLSNEVQNFVYIGSSCMYPRDFRQPLVESDVLQGPLEPTNEGYALAKITAAKLCEYASQTRNVNYKTIIPSNLYGPGDKFNSDSSHLLASVIRKIHEIKKSRSQKINVWGSGLARREFTYVEDLSEWISKSLHLLSKFPPLLNVGCGKDYSVNEFYLVALEALEVRADLEHDLSKPEGMRAKLMDSSLAMEMFNWNPSTDLKSGIQATYKWFVENT